MYEQEFNKEGKEELKIDVNQEQEDEIKSFGNVDLNNPAVQKLVQEKIEKMKRITNSDLKTNQFASEEEMIEAKKDIFANKNPKPISEKGNKNKKK